MPELPNSNIPATLTFSDVASLPWLPWAMQGAKFKLLHADADSCRYTLLIKVEKGAVAPVHRHLGAVEAYVLEGSFHYADQPHIRFMPGHYLFEQDGAVHQPVSDEGAVMFAVFHGAVEGLDADGKVTGRIDCKWHVKTWNRALSGGTV